MKTKLYNQEGEAIGEIELPEEIFGQKINPDLLHQVVVSYQKNQRQPIAHTKNRGEVRGSTRKIWPQKGLGRARHGDRRAPIFRKGGVAFGPRNEKKLKVKIPKKMKRKALVMALSAKAKDNEIVVLDKLTLEKPKTKIFAKILENLKKNVESLKKGSILICLPEKDEKIYLSARNIPQVSVLEAKNLNAFEVLKFKNLILLERTVEVMKKFFQK